MKYFHRLHISLKILTVVLFFGLLAALIYVFVLHRDLTALKARTLAFLDSEAKSAKKIAQLGEEISQLKTRDEYKINQSQKEEIDNIKKTYDSAVKSYEKLVDFNTDKNKRAELDKKFAKTLKLLAEKNFASASATLAEIEKTIEEENKKAAASFKIPENVVQSNTPPASGFSSQKVHIDSGDFLVSIVTADLSSTKVIVDTASDSDCRDNCPVLSLQDYVSRSGAFAGINGSFFCPATYPSCAGKTNSFDTLLMNKNKHYFNSDNNVYSTVPAAIFSAGSARFVSRSLEWGRDTSVDAVIANWPLYVISGNNNFSGSGDAKIDSKGSRTFLAVAGSKVYMGIVYNSTGAEAAKVLQTMGMRDAIGMDQGGSTALWFGGYKAGPGRGIPNAVLFVRR